METPGNRKGEDHGDVKSSAETMPPAADQVLLPRYISRQADGLYVSLQAFDSASHFSSFLDRIFGAGMRFENLHYDNLNSLLYYWGTSEVGKLTRELEAAGKSATLRLASDIVPFAPQRQKYYQNVKLIEGGNAAQYRFEPILAEPGPAPTSETDDSSTAQEEIEAEEIKLDVDEFIAAMWCKDVRFGIDIALLKEAFERSTSEVAVVARMAAATEGQDATVAELIDTLHRSNVPKLLPDGRVDLHQFENRFPQMEINTKLIKKVPRVAGKSGWTLTGKEIAPNLPLDFDIGTLSGPGTRVERSSSGEFIVADIAGFLQIDPATRLFSISDKIVNREGVSQRTTGNLVLSAEEYEEHGIVEEHAQVEAKHMTFMADVFGDLVSRGGTVVLKANLNAGSIRNPEGTITIDGKASRSSIEALGGAIVLRYAESCRIIGAKVSVETAVHCDILAQEVTVDNAEGCTLAGQKIQVGTATDRHDIETTIAVMVPDMSTLKQQLEELRHQQAECEAIIGGKRAERDALSEQQEIKTYQLLNAKLRAHELNMTHEQDANWQKLLVRVAPILKRIRAFNDDLREVLAVNENLTEKIELLKHETSEASLDISCDVANINGETMIRTLVVRAGQAALETLPARELRARLRATGADGTVLFSDSSGEFAWQWSDGAADEDQAKSAVADQS